MKNLKKIALALLILIYLDITISVVAPEPPAALTAVTDPADPGCDRELFGNDNDHSLH